MMTTMGKLPPPVESLPSPVGRRPPAAGGLVSLPPLDIIIQLGCCRVCPRLSGLGQTCP